MKTMILSKLTMVLVLSAWIAGCATSNLSSIERTEAYNQFISTEKLEDLDQITTFRFDSWSSLGQEHLIISTSFNRPYLITLRNNCLDLRTVEHIVVNNTGSTLQAKFDSITVPKYSQQRCFIKSIHKLTKEQKKAILKIGSEKKDEVDSKKA